MGNYSIYNTEFPKREFASFATINGLQKRLAKMGYGDKNASDLAHIYHVRVWNYNGKQYRIVIDDDGEFFEAMIRQKFWNGIAEDGVGNAFRIEFEEGEAVIEFINQHNYCIDNNPDPSQFDIPEDDAKLWDYYYTEDEDNGLIYYLATLK